MISEGLFSPCTLYAIYLIYTDDRGLCPLSSGQMCRGLWPLEPGIELVADLVYGSQKLKGASVKCTHTQAPCERRKWGSNVCLFCFHKTLCQAGSLSREDWAALNHLMPQLISNQCTAAAAANGKRQTASAEVAKGCQHFTLQWSLCLWGAGKMALNTHTHRQLRGRERGFWGWRND